jgi:hypothetical protein
MNRIRTIREVFDMVTAQGRRGRARGNTAVIPRSSGAPVLSRKEQRRLEHEQRQAAAAKATGKARP